MKKMIPLLLALCLLLGVLSGCGKTVERQSPPEPSAALAAPEAEALSLKFAESYDEVYSAVDDAKEVLRVQNAMYEKAAMAANGMMLDDAISSVAAEGQGDGTYYSNTNVQVAGVDEGDIVKTDGTYFYILRDFELIIMQADGETVTDVSHTILGSQWESVEQTDGSEQESQKMPIQFYLTGDRAVVISEDYHGFSAADGSWESESFLSVDILDLGDRTAPKVVKTLGQDGYLIDSRMIDDKLYLCTSYYVFDTDQNDSDTFVPCLYTDGVKAPVDCGTIGILPGGGSTTYTVVTSYDVAAAGVITTQSILGGGHAVYMNPDNLYLADVEYKDTVLEEGEDGPYTVTSHLNEPTTTIHRFAVSDGKLTYAATGKVPGSLDSQFNMDEQDGKLRVVTAMDSNRYQIYVDSAHNFENYEPGETARSSSVYVLGADLKPVGSVTDLAPDEVVYSVRFDGDWGYLCTYRTTDPIFAVDLSDPENPHVTGAVKLPGYSDYLHVWSDGLLFGLGMQTQEITDENGEVTARLDGMKLVMIDTSDPANLSECSTLAIDADYSEALYNHKAILVDQPRNLIAFPAEGSYLIYGYTDDGGFALKKEVSVGEWDWESRGVYIGEYFYIIGTDNIQVLDLNSLEIVNEVFLSRG